MAAAKNPMKALTPILCCAALAATPCAAADWRFCVAVVAESHKTLISDVFSNAADSDKLERRLEQAFRARTGQVATFQCPLGGPEKLDALNAQTVAITFNRKLGYQIENLPAAEIASLLGPGF